LGQVHVILQGFPNDVGRLAFSPDGRLLATACNPNEKGWDALIVWDVATGRELYQLGPFQRGCDALLITPDGKTLITAGGREDGHILLWDLATKKVRQTLRGNPYVTTCLALSRDGRLLATTGAHGAAVLWDLKTGKERATLGTIPKSLAPGPHPCAECVAFSPDGNRLAVAGHQIPLTLWDVDSGKKLAALQRHNRRVPNLAFAPDGRTLWTMDEEGLLVHWDVATATEVRAVPLRWRLRVWAASADGSTLALVPSNRILLYDLARDRFRTDFKGAGQPGYIWCVAFSPDGKYLATGGGGHLGRDRLYLWKMPDLKKRD
jgi:WD40 repeat protein